MNELTCETMEALSTVLPVNAMDMCSEELRTLLQKRKEKNEAVAVVCRQALKAYYDDIAQRSQEIHLKIRLLQAEAEKNADEQLETMDMLLRAGALGAEDETERLYQRHKELSAQGQAIAAHIEALERFVVPPNEDLFHAFINAYDALRKDNAEMLSFVDAVKYVAGLHAQEWDAVLEYDSSCAKLPNISKIAKNYYQRRPLSAQEEQGQGETK